MVHPNLMVLVEMQKLIRIEDESGVGVYRAKTSYWNFDFSNFIYIIGVLTRAPYDNMVAKLMRDTHPEESKIETDFQWYMESVYKERYQFGWDKEFFLRIASGLLTESETSFVRKYCNKVGESREFELPKQDFLEILFDNGFIMYEILVKPEHKTEQQGIFNRSRAEKKMIADWNTLME